MLCSLDSRNRSQLWWPWTYADFYGGMPCLPAKTQLIQEALNRFSDSNCINCKIVCLCTAQHPHPPSLQGMKRDKALSDSAQAAVRMHTQRNLYRKQQRSAVLLQSAVRRMQQRSRFVQVSKYLLACHKILQNQPMTLDVDRQESPVHARLYGRLSRQRNFARVFVQHKQAAICIQRVQRGRAVRMVMAQRAAAATVVQKCWRGCVQRRAYQRMRAAAVRLQSAVRCWQLRSRFLQAGAAAITLQRFARGAVVRRAVARQRGAAVAIQSAWRQRQAMRRYAQDVQNVTSAQASVNTWLVVKVLHAVEASEVLRQLCKSGCMKRLVQG